MKTLHTQGITTGFICVHYSSNVLSHIRSIRTTSSRWIHTYGLFGHSSYPSGASPLPHSLPLAISPSHSPSFPLGHCRYWACTAFPDIGACITFRVIGASSAPIPIPHLPLRRSYNPSRSTCLPHIRSSPGNFTGTTRRCTPRARKISRRRRTLKRAFRIYQISSGTSRMGTTMRASRK